MNRTKISIETSDVVIVGCLIVVALLVYLLIRRQPAQAITMGNTIPFSQAQQQIQDIKQVIGGG